METIIGNASDSQIPQQGGLRTHLITGATGSFLIQLGFAGLAFLNAILLARLLGASGYGAFANAMAWVSLLVVPAAFGFGTLIVRNVAIYRSRAEWMELKGLIRFSNSYVLAFSVFLSFVFVATVGFVFSDPEQDVMRLSLWAAAPLLPLLALLNLRESTIRGLEHVFRARLPGMVIRPGLLLIGISLVHLFRPGHLSAPLALAINGGAAIGALVLAMFWQRKVLPFQGAPVTPKYHARLWLGSAFPMLIFGGMQVLLGQTDIVMLGVMRGAADVGLYAAAARLALVLGYVLEAAEVIMAPIMARLYAKREGERLQKMLTFSVRISFLAVLPLGLALIFLGEDILAVFGDEFSSAHFVLAILAAGRLTHVAFGPGALLLSMTGHEKFVAIVLAVTAMLNVMGNAVLIPYYGIHGAAIAAVVSVILMRCVLSIYAVKRTGLHMTILGAVTSQSFRARK